jgi:hypothetical protein
MELRRGDAVRVLLQLDSVSAGNTWWVDAAPTVDEVLFLDPDAFSRRYLEPMMANIRWRLMERMQCPKVD